MKQIALCTYGQAVRCDHKRNVKPYIACAYDGECPAKQEITEISHGQELVERIKKINGVI